MTMGYGCAGDNCQQAVNWLLTHMKPAGTLPVCDEHFPVFNIGMLAEFLGVDPGRLYEAIRKHVDREAAKAAKAAADRYEAAALESEVDESEADHQPGTPPMSRQAEDETASGGLVIDRGATP